MYKKAVRLGSINTSVRVQQAVANITLEGLQPSLQAVELTHKLASGDITANEAVTILCRLYGQQT